MLEGNRIAPIPGAGEPGPDGFVDIPVNQDEQVSITFPNPPTELSTVKVKPPTDTLPGDDVTVDVTYTDEDGNEETQVTFVRFSFTVFASEILQKQTSNLILCSIPHLGNHREGD